MKVARRTLTFALQLPCITYPTPAVVVLGPRFIGVLPSVPLSLVNGLLLVVVRSHVCVSLILRRVQGAVRLST